MISWISRLRRLLSLVPLAAPCLAVLAAGGCTTLSTSSPGAVDTLARAAPDPARACTVQFRSRQDRPETVTIPWREGMVLQDALTQTEAARRFRRMRVSVHRRSPEGKQAKMQATYDSRTGRIDPTTDYALYPGDHIVVEEDARTILDDMLDDALKPLSPLLSSNI